jgi:hypothetical protein
LECLQVASVTLEDCSANVQSDSETGMGAPEITADTSNLIGR